MRLCSDRNQIRGYLKRGNKGRRATTKGHEASCRSNGEVHYLDCGDDFTALCIGRVVCINMCNVRTVLYTDCDALPLKIHRFKPSPQGDDIRERGL